MTKAKGRQHNSRAQIIVFTENGTNWDPNNPGVIVDENGAAIRVTEDTSQIVASILNSELYQIFNRDVEQPHNNVHVRCGCIMTTGMLLNCFPFDWLFLLM